MIEKKQNDMIIEPVGKVINWKSLSFKCLQEA